MQIQKANFFSKKVSVLARNVVHACFKKNNEFFAAPPDFSDCFYLKNKVLHDECTFSIQSLATLEQLLAEKRLKKEDPVLRFLVDTSGAAWFARETGPWNQAPKHFQMTGLPQNEACCSTAGNIKFTNTTCSVLKNINHKSGDFHPSFHSLRSFIAILIVNEDHLPFKLPKILCVKEIGNDGNVKKKHLWSKARLRTWVNTVCTNQELVKQLLQQGADNKIVHYEASTI